MHRKLYAILITYCLLIACDQTIAKVTDQPTVDVGSVDNKYVWDLTHLFPDQQAWEEARIGALQQIEYLETLKGTLGKRPQSLLAASDQISQTYKQVARIYVYANLMADTDTRNAENEERSQMARNLLTDLGTAVSWYNPELLALGEEKIQAFIATEPALKKHRFGMENSLRQAPHILSEDIESVLAKTEQLLGGPDSIYSILANANMPWPELTLSNGETIRLSQAGYSAGRQATARGDRKKVFDTFWSVWKDYEATLGAIMNTHIQGLVFQTNVRHYESSVGRALFDDNLPPEVYNSLVAEVNKGLPTLHRYFKLRKRMLDIKDDMRYYDIYPPLVNLDKTYSIEDSIDITRRALQPLGEEYLTAYDKGVEGGWMHVYPAPGKRSGAYMSGWAYDVHPYVLLNHNDDYESASTFAHEYGHAVHSVLANKTQPWETAPYSTFIAETAAIMNEMLLQDLVVSEAKNDQEKLFYLGIGLEALRGTFFRQTMFAEFELKINQEVEAGNVLTGAKLSQMYLELLKRYHGHDEGIVTIDDLYGIEWAYIPHFYYDFYVFQYSTSIAAASSFAAKIGNGDMGVKDDFIDMLKAGGSDHPYELMKKAGLDMASPEPYQALMTRMNTIMDQMEAILDNPSN